MEQRSPWLHRYAVFVSAAIVCLIFFGGQVKSSDAGLSVPDWPNTYGHFMFSFPYEQMVGGIFWEHSHRMIASITGILTFILTFWVYRVDTRKWVRRLAAFASAAVLIQGILGGLTVLFLLPAWISSSHGTLAQIYFCTVVAVALVTSPRWSDTVERRTDAGTFGLRNVALLTTIAIVVQLILGAIMRHTESGMAIPDFPTMFGSWIPPLSAERLSEANKELWKLGLLWKFGNAEITLGQMIVHLSHRLWACVVTGMIIWTSVKVYRLRPVHPALRRNAVVMMALVAVQITLGILTILTERQFTVTTLHVVTGALTLASSLVLTINVRHLLAEHSSPVRIHSVVHDEVTA